MIPIVALATLLMVPLTGGQGTPSTELAGTEAEIHRMHTAFNEAWNRHDAAALAAMWTREGDYVEPDGRLVQGREAIEKHLGLEHKSVFANSRLHLVVERARLVANGTAVVDGSYELFGAVNPKGEAIGTRSGYFTTVLVRTESGWSVAAARLMLPQVLIWRER
ncbi:MAG TPA: SgcJ/EcaC family oxidoreductase [Terriglobales bacterium]|nr:SgcJ/EcaC family oxidoreductase [Terriglobales bacterium]